MNRRDRESDHPDHDDQPEAKAQSAAQSTGQLDRQLNVLVSAQLHAALKAGAMTRGCSLAEVVRQALGAMLPGSAQAPLQCGSQRHANAGHPGGTAAVPTAAARLDAQAYQQLVRYGGNLNQALRAINSGRGEPGDWPIIVEAARAVIALKRHVAGLPAATPAEEAAAITLRREAVGSVLAPVTSAADVKGTTRPGSPRRDDEFSTVL